MSAPRNDTTPASNRRIGFTTGPFDFIVAKLGKSVLTMITSSAGLRTGLVGAVRFGCELVLNTSRPQPIRRIVRRMSFSYWLHVLDLPGNADLALPSRGKI